VCIQKILAAIGPPAHWPFQLARGVTNQRILLSKAGFHAEATTDIPHDYPEILGFSLEHIG
jgi:hypothetical protein